MQIFCVKLSMRLSTKTGNDANATNLRSLFGSVTSKWMTKEAFTSSSLFALRSLLFVFVVLLFVITDGGRCLSVVRPLLVFLRLLFALESE